MSVKVLKLASPLRWEDRTIDEITFVFDDLTGADVEACIRQATLDGDVPTQSLPMWPSLLIRLAARAGNVPHAAMRKLPAKLYVEAATIAQGFLMGTD